MILPFLSPTLREVDIEAQWEVSSSATSRLLRILHAVLPHDIASLRFVPNGDMEYESEEVMWSTLNARNCLQALRLPSCPVNASMLIPHLRILEAIFGEAWDSEPGAFFLHLSDNCPLIEHLRIIFLNDSMLTVESIRPLLRFCKLRSLDLESPGEVDLQDNHITDMGNAWRELEAFHISSRRGYISRSTLPTGTPIASLVTFAQAFSPKLRQLAIHINSSYVPLPPDPPVRFPNLEFFSVGTSQLDYSEAEQRRVIGFLGSVLPSRITYIHSDILSYDWSRSVFKPKEDGGRTTSAVWDTLSQILYDYRKV